MEKKQRKFVKVVGSDVRLEWPQKQVMCADNYHWTYEDDKTQPPIRCTIPATILEDNGDGTYTRWGFTVFGPIGHTGPLKPEIQITDRLNRQDQEEVERILRCEARALKAQAAMFIAMGGNPQAVAAA